MACVEMYILDSVAKCISVCNSKNTILFMLNAYLAGCMDIELWFSRRCLRFL